MRASQMHGAAVRSLRFRFNVYNVCIINVCIIIIITAYTFTLRYSLLNAFTTSPKLAGDNEQILIWTKPIPDRMPPEPKSWQQ